LSLAGLAIAPAITFALLAEPILVFAGEPQLLTLTSASTAAAVVHADAARSYLEGLSGDECRKY